MRTYVCVRAPFSNSMLRVKFTKSNGRVPYKRKRIYREGRQRDGWANVCVFRESVSQTDTKAASYRAAIIAFNSHGKSPAVITRFVTV